MKNKNIVSEPFKNLPPMSQWNFPYEKAYQLLSLLDFRSITSLKLCTYAALVEYLKKKNPEKFDHLDTQSVSGDGLYNFNGDDDNYIEIFGKDMLFYLEIRLFEETDRWCDLVIYFYLGNKVTISLVGPRDSEWREVIDHKFPKKLNKKLTWEDGFCFLKNFYEETVIAI